jgi:hypothetical protein
MHLRSVYAVERDFDPRLDRSLDVHGPPAECNVALGRPNHFCAGLRDPRKLIGAAGPIFSGSAKVHWESTRGEARQLQLQ